MTNQLRINAMEEAIRQDNVAKVRVLLKAGVPAAHQLDSGSTFAQMAAHFGHVEILEMLVAGGAPLDGSLLNAALYSPAEGRGSLVRMILDRGQPSSAQLTQGLMVAVEKSSPEIVGWLLDAGADLSYKDEYKSTPLLQAVYLDNEAAALLLLERGANPSIRVPYDEYYKLTLPELAQAKGMARLVAALAGGGNPAPAAQPATMAACWNAIDGWLAAHAPVCALPRPIDPAALPAVALPLTQDYLTSLSIHDGSGDEPIVPMPGEISHTLLSLNAALSERQDMLAVYASEPTHPGPGWWNESWLPISTNGGGDYLLLDLGDGSVHVFSHETRRRQARAPSLLALWQDIAAGLASGKYAYSTADGIA